MKPNEIVLLPALCVTISVLLPATADTSPHRQRMVSVTSGVSIEVLDWGGRGPSVVLLTGFGNTAHVYDDLAPRLAKDFPVSGITRREYGRSTAAPPGLTIDRLAEESWRYSIRCRNHHPERLPIGCHTRHCRHTTDFASLSPARDGRASTFGKHGYVYGAAT